jgi:hypothetical protein
VGRGGDGLESGGGAQAAQARTRGGGSSEVGQGVGQGGYEGRLAKAHATARVGGFASQVGGGAYLLVALSELRRMSKDYTRGFVLARKRSYICGHDPFDGEAPSPWLRISKQFQKAHSRKSA